jgi:hypothetical protein
MACCSPPAVCAVHFIIQLQIWSEKRRRKPSHKKGAALFLLLNQSVYNGGDLVTQVLLSVPLWHAGSNQLLVSTTAY